MLAADILSRYDTRLNATALAPRTRSSYRRWVTELVEHLAAGDELGHFFAPASHDDRRARPGC